MRAVTRIVLGATLAVCSALSSAQTSEPPTAASAKAQAEVSFQFDRTGLPVPRFTLRLKEDGTGRYEADQAEIAATATSMRGQAAQHIDRPINLSNIADTGKKTLSYTGPDGSGSCTYNYSENKTVGTQTDTFLAIAYTIDEGRRLEFLHRYDRLGLDAEMISLAQEVEAGRALELGTISPALAAIADDTAVIQRVRLKAQKMLEQVAAEGH
jgi:hypothetical protein